jgi:N-acetylglucosamine-6-phosphate deacetylase
MVEVGLMKNAKENVVVRGVILGQKTPSDIVLRNGVVVRVVAAGRGRPDLGSRDAIIAPTLFDIQVNGYGGIDLQGPELTAGEVVRLSRLLAQTGVGRWAPTLMTAPQRAIERNCRVLAEAMQDAGVKRAVPGIHIEGPYISPMDGPRGAHAKQHVRKPSLREFERWMKAADGKILYITLAPEHEGAVPFIKEVTKQGVLVSLGHHNATPDQIARAVDAGARLCTHLGNGLASQIPRHHNPLWPQLADDRLTCSLIADLQHLPASVLKTFVRAKGPERIVLTSDVVHIAGLPPGHYDLAGIPVELKSTGRICLSGTDLLGGSSLMLLRGVLNAAAHTDLTLAEAFACASTVPARLFALKTPPWPPKPGAKAEFIVLRPANHAPATRRIVSVWLNGALVRENV